MKKFFIAMLVAVMALVSAQAVVQKNYGNKSAVANAGASNVAEQDYHEQDVDSQSSAVESESTESEITNELRFTRNGVVVRDAEGNDVEVSINDLNRIISKHLDDTVLTAQDEVRDLGSTNVDDFAIRGMALAESIAQIFAVAIICVVFFSLMFYYLHRRRKYKTVDRAIEAGYPLPDEFFGKRSPRAPQQPTNVYVTQVTPPAAAPNAPHDTRVAQGYGQSSNPLKNITDWAPFKKGFMITAWGLGLLFFFWIVGATPIAALMMIVVFIGLGKLFVAYQEQQNLRDHWQQQQWAQQPQQPPHNVPPMPETPPEFNPNE